MTTSREIRIFISSTFDDLVEERELLMKSVWLRLQQKCRRRGVELVFIDLRWGISAERKLAEVIDLCLTAVADCYPYFIAILGERYGRIYDFQSPKYAEKYADLQAKYTWLKDHNPQSSVTELEILQALALAEQHRTSEPVTEFMRGYFRDSASPQPSAQFPKTAPESRERLAALKQRIRASGLPVRTYQQPDELANWILRDLWHFINRCFPLSSRLTPQQQEALEHELFARSRQSVYIERPADLQRLDAQAASNDPPLIILGESGVGKSALLANWALSYRERHPQDVVIFHFIGSSPYSTEEVALLRRIMTELQAHFIMTESLPADPQQLSECLPFWFAAAHAQAEQQGCRVILILDGLNQLAETAQPLNWLPRFIPQRIRLLVATLPGISLTALESRAWSTLTVTPLTEPERQDLIQRYLRRYHKELSPHHVQQLVAALLTANPLYLRVLLEELRLFGKHSELGQQLDNYLAADSVVALYQKVLTRLATDYERERPQLVRDALTVLWAARRGLTETEWLTMLSSSQPLPQNQWLPFFLAVREALINRNSLWGFAHDYFRQAVQQSYLPTVTDQQAAHRRLASYFSQQPLDSRQADELPYHWFHTGENSQLQTCISEIPMFYQLIQDDKEYELWKYWRYLGTSANMVACYKTTLAEYEKTVLTPIELADLLNQLAGFFNTTGNFSAAEPLYRRALAIYEQELGADHPATASSLNNLAILLGNQGNYAAAEPLYRRALAILEQELGANHPDTASSLNNLAILLGDQGNYAAAEPLYRRALAICEQELGANHSDTAGSLNNLAILLGDQGNYAEAEPLYRRALAIREQELGANHPDTATSLDNLANLLEDQGNYAAAEPLYRRALAIREQELGANHPATATSLNNLASLLEDQGDYVGAEPLYRRALAILETKLPPNHPNIITVRNNLSQLLKQKS